MAGQFPYSSYTVGYEIPCVSQYYRMRDPTPTLTLPLEGEGIAELRKCYP